MRVLFVTSEVATLYKRGGLADVSYALPVALRKQKVDISIALPFFEVIKPKEPVYCIGQLAIDYDRRRELVFIYQTVLKGTKVPVFLFRHPRLNEYSGKDIEERFAFFSKAVAELYRASPGILGGAFDIIHCNDWHTALIPILMGEENKWQREASTLGGQTVKTILTIHNLLYQGETGMGLTLRLGIPKERFHVFTTPLGRAVKILREGLEYVDVITTVSPTYAKEIMHNNGDHHIKSVLKRRNDKVLGILNGLDNDLWNPKTDKALPTRFDRKSALKGKRAVKAYLQRSLGLPESDLPLFGFVGRLEPRQKGIDLVSRMVKQLPATEYQLAMLGTGFKKQVKLFEALSKSHPNIAFVHTFDERLARRIYAGSDAMLVPSKFEPCGLTQMIAMRYGSIPIVRKTGGLADTVIDEKTGFVFGPYTTRGLVGAVERAIKLYTFNQKKWQRMITRVMAQDFSWKKQAREYKKLYERLAKS